MTKKGSSQATITLIVVVILAILLFFALMKYIVKIRGSIVP